MGPSTTFHTVHHGCQRDASFHIRHPHPERNPRGVQGNERGHCVVRLLHQFHVVRSVSLNADGVRWSYDRGNTKAIRMRTADEMQERAIELARKQRRDITYKWTLHKQVRPCKIMVLRSEKAHLGVVPPPTGSRLGTQLLARFDTMQVRSTRLQAIEYARS